MKTISWITDLINNIPELLNYFVPGYIFISIYNFMLLKKANVQEGNFIILKSIAISYILKTLYDKIITQWEIEVLYVEIDPLLNVIILLFISLILGYLLGLIGYSPVANKFLLRFGIHRTVKENIWANVIKKGHYIRVFKKDYSKSYCGQCTFYENDTREPIIVLSRYVIYNDNAEVICDYSNDDTASIVLNLKDFERVDVFDQTKDLKETYNLKNKKLKSK